MANTDDKPAFKITLEDLEKVALPQDAPAPNAAAAAATGAARRYGSISDQPDAPELAQEKGSILLQGWFYLGAAGLLGAIIGWGICEPAFVDARNFERWGNVLLIPMVLLFCCLGFGIAESIVERSLRKALWRLLLVIPLGAALGFVFDFVANIFFTIGVQICVSLGVHTEKNPAFWIARGLAWMVFGIAAGIIYGLVDRSMQKARYGILGGLIGAGLGGVLFDPISFLTGAGAPSRLVGFGLLGLATGVAMGIVESALKDRWLYVASGPLAGKQFILYKPLTVIGSSQQSDIYLFKDNSILAQHGSIELRGAQTVLRAAGPVFVSGHPVRQQRVLASGDLIQIGRYAFHFRERRRK